MRDLLLTTHDVLPTDEAPRPTSSDSEPAEAFLKALYERHGSLLLCYAARLLGGDWHRAEDVLQEAAIRAWRNAANLGDPTAETVRPWLFTVVRNLVIDGHRARQARPPEVAEPELPSIPVPDWIDRVLTKQAVVEAMRELPPIQREVLLHVYFIGRSTSQTATVLGVPRGTIKSRTYYAVRALREILQSRDLLVD
ncbi:RNA polymerase sigma-70 factor (ECF subfamily) [Streptomyces sp. V4I23]|uniref:sigma-70 family RNA polymerase sigma factor n=1 Tax=Streptomyces sp. V4I23 TaxID=3042282 RepID=UPI002785AB82|nr:sigma-70 family RNA polymerase sigma factor [Streptomyces sp. V4I23]MDQ1005898.1 RNA polymerase sigma-70 factor (ECF subfamily) [Streptomyces sp. V4I23]